MCEQIVGKLVYMSRDGKQEMKGRDKEANTVNLEHYANKPAFFL